MNGASGKETPPHPLTPEEAELAAVDPEHVYETVDSVVTIHSIPGGLGIADRVDFGEHLACTFRMISYHKACEAFILGLPADRVALVTTAYATALQMHAEAYLSPRN